MIVKKNKDFSRYEINATKFGPKNYIQHIIIYHNVTSYGYFIMIIVDSCIIWIHLDWYHVV